MVTEDGRKMIRVIQNDLPKHSCDFGDGYERAVNIRAKVKVASEQLTIAMFDGNAAGGGGYNEYLNGYVYIFYGWSNTKHRLSRGAGSSNVWLTDQITATAAQQNNYYVLEARWLDADNTEGDNLFGLVDGEIPGSDPKLEAEDSEYTSRSYLGFASWSNAEWRIDRVYVRKCASVEPVAEIGREFNKPAISSPMPAVLTTSFEYDDYNKLTEITFPDSTTETLSYDDNGQLVMREKSTGETTNYQWNDQGMLVKVILPTGEPVEYFYDGNQRLISRKSSDGVDNFVQSGWDIVTKMDDVGKRTYYTGSSAIEDRESVKYFHYNHRGDTVLVTDANGEILHNLSCEAYGKPTNSEGIPFNSLSLKDLPNLFVGASGIRYDTKTNLHYMRFRWFSGEQMRFISSDPILAGNRFSYANSNPVKWIDPVGLHEITVDFQEATYPNGTHFINVHVEVNFDNPASVYTPSASPVVGQIAGSSVNSGNIAGNNNSKILQSALVNAGIASAVYTGAGITVGVPVIAMGALLPPFLTRLAEAQLAEMMAQYFIEYPILKHLHHLGAKAYSIFGENSPLARLSVFEHIYCIHSRLAEQGYPVQEGKDFWGKFFKNKKKKHKFLTRPCLQTFFSPEAWI